MNGRQPTPLRVALPKGRMQARVVELLEDAGIRILATARGYRPRLSLPDCEVKILKPQNIVEMLQLGSRDVGLTGADWVAELDGEAVELATVPPPVTAFVAAEAMPDIRLTPARRRVLDILAEGPARTPAGWNTVWTALRIKRWNSSPSGATCFTCPGSSCWRTN